MRSERGRLGASGVVRNRLVLRGVVALGLSASGLVAASIPASAASPLCGGPGSGSSTRQTSDGQTHTYYYRIPNTPVPASGRPVLIWMHGDGGTGAPPTGSEFYPYTDPDGAIVVTPNGINQTWTHAAGDLAGQPEDSQFISLILDDLDTCSSVDHTKYFLYGVSRGAYMPYYLLRRSSTRSRIAGAAINAGLLYCQTGDSDCVDGSSPTLDTSTARILHLHGTDDTEVEPPPTATFHNPIDWNIDWRVFYPMQNWAHQHGCFDGANPSTDNGVLKETYAANGHTARVYDLTGHGPACAKYQLILVDNGGHVIANQESRVWSFLMGPRPATAPPAPSASAGPGQVFVAWSNPTSFGSGSFTRWEVVNAATNAVVCTQTTQSSRFCTVSGLTNGTTYTFKVRAVTSAGDGPLSPASNGATPAVPAAGAFTPVAPFRLLDSRPAPDNVGIVSGKIPAHADATFQVAGRGGVPAAADPTHAAAVVLNVAVTGATAPGVVTAHPANEAAPTAANLNYVAGQTISNHVTVKLSPDGQASLLNDSSAPIHLIADVSGWYAAGTPSAPGTFTPMSPKRLLDTRPAPDNVGAPAGKIPGQGKVDFAVAGQGVIPDASQVSAGVFNLAVTAPTMAGFITGFPTGNPVPNAANLNYVSGQTLSNAATVKLGTAGKVTLFNGQLSTATSAHYIADANGWFRSGTATLAGAYTPLEPKRILDTRPAPDNVGGFSKVGANSSITLTVVGAGGVPATGVGAVVFNLAVTGTSAPGVITAHPADVATPLAANLNYGAGETISNLVTVKLSGDGKVKLVNTGTQPVHLVADVAGYYRKDSSAPQAASLCDASADASAVALANTIDGWKAQKLMAVGQQVNINNDQWQAPLTALGTPQPKIIGFDFREIATGGSSHIAALIQAAQNGAILTGSWHALNPWDQTQSAWSGTPDQKSHLADVANPATTAGAAFTTMYNTEVIDVLKQFRNAGIPVIVRPLHEAGQSQFWWGRYSDSTALASHPAAYRAVFKRVQDLTAAAGVHNVLWSYAGVPKSWSGITPATDLLPACVDLAGMDTYDPENAAFGDDPTDQVDLTDYATLAAAVPRMGFTEVGPFGSNGQWSPATVTNTLNTNHLYAAYAMFWFDDGDGSQRYAGKKQISSLTGGPAWLAGCETASGQKGMCKLN